MYILLQIFDKMNMIWEVLEYKQDCNLYPHKYNCTTPQPTNNVQNHCVTMLQLEVNKELLTQAYQLMIHKYYAK